jgi:hypothetical protein
MKKLPTGIQSFSGLRSNDYLYVDKTEVIYHLVTTGKIFFLSRPRLFGKSLLVSTLDTLFNGRQELFEGLYIYDKWDWTQKHPVIRIDWTRIPLQDVDRLRDTVAACICNCEGQDFADCLKMLPATVPNELKMNCEAHYHALTLIWLRFPGFEVHAEVSTNLGRADAVWKQPGLTIVAELEYHRTKDKETLLHEAMEQIHKRRYYTIRRSDACCFWASPFRERKPAA